MTDQLTCGLCGGQEAQSYMVKDSVGYCHVRGIDCTRELRARIEAQADVIAQGLSGLFRKIEQLESSLILDRHHSKDELR